MQQKLLLFVFTLFLFSTKVNAQCNPCPDRFDVSDSTNCRTYEVSKNCSFNGTGGYANCITISACKNTRQVYTITPVGFTATGVPCVYPTFIYSPPTITGGTVESYGNNQIIIQWGNANTGSILIPFNSPLNASVPCRDTILLNFNLLNNPVAAFTASPQPACFNSPSNINFNSSASVGAVSYFWKFGDGFTSTLANPTHAYTSSGTYTACLIVSNTAPAPQGQPSPCPSCIDSICKSVIINNLPSPEILCVATVCAGDTATYCTTAASCTSYAWTVTGGTIISGAGTNCIKVVWGSGNPQGTINLIATGCVITYCPQGATVTVPIIPTSTTITGPITVCINTTAAYSLPSFPGTTYSWTLSSGGGIVGNNTNTNQININWNSIGMHTITCNYFDTALNCGGVGTITVNVLPILKISGVNAYCQNQISTLQAFYSPPSTNVSCTWTISPAGAVITGGQGTPFVTVNWGAANVYTVTATATTAGIVCSNATYKVTVYPKPIITGINGPDSVCKNKTYVYSAASNQAGLFTWFVTNGTSSNLGANNDSVQVTWGGSGPYILNCIQTSYANNCISNILKDTSFAYPTPNVVGPTNVCADAIVSYTITNIASGNFNWYVTPASFGTIQSGQGTNTLVIKWHGNNSPGSSNVVYLHFGVCGTDSIAITINEPALPVINGTGTLCGGGVNLSTVSPGTYSWSCVEHPIVPAQPTNLPTLTGLTLPGHYVLQVTNGGCVTSNVYNVPDVGRPNAHISANAGFFYCMPTLPNMTLVENPVPGATYQWFLNGVPIPTATTNSLNVNSGPPVNITGPGSYLFYCQVTLGSCVVNSNTILITVAPTCPAPGCVGVIKINSITGCNPFTINISSVSPPSAYIIPGTTSIFHYLDGSTVAGNVTNTFNTIGYQPIKISCSVKNNDSSVCLATYDTSVLVRAAANFSKSNNCGVVTLTNLSAVIPATIISSYNWTLGTYPSNTPTGNGTFNNNAIPNPILTFTVGGSYIITQTITTIAPPCTTTRVDTINISIANANFVTSPSCVGTPVTFSNPPSFVDFWDFGDAATSYVSPTSHAWATAGTFSITHIVTNAQGCTNTVVRPILINPTPTCVIGHSPLTTFCFGDSLLLSGCAGFTNYQWYNNGVAIAAPAGTAQNYYATQTGNYYFFAYDGNGCKVISDTVAITVIQPPSANMNVSSNRCAGNPFSIGVPLTAGCTYSWMVDGITDPTVGNLFAYIIGAAPLTIGTHLIKVTVTNSFGCTNSDSVTVTFFPNPIVNISVLGGPPFLCSNNLYTLQATTSAPIPIWVWNYNLIGINLSSTNTLQASSAGSYTVFVTNSVTGCKSSAVKIINQSPELNLFPVGCDTLCDTSHIFLPLGSIFGNLTGYTITWYDNAPPYGTPVGTGISFNLNTLPIGNHNLSVIVTAPNGCADTSNVYSLKTFNCQSVLAIKELQLSAKWMSNYAQLNWSVNEEIDIDYYIVESSVDGIHFTNLNKVYSRGNSYTKQEYSSMDFVSKLGLIIYYRIRAVDKNGLKSYSNIVQLKPIRTDIESMVVIPNITNNKTRVIIQSNTACNTKLVLLSTDGKEQNTIPIHLNKGLNEIPLNVSNIATGIYYVKIATDTRVISAVFVKN
jgi:PKD domain/PKD-like domain